MNDSSIQSTLKPVYNGSVYFSLKSDFSIFLFVNDINESHSVPEFKKKKSVFILCSKTNRLLEPEKCLLAPNIFAFRCFFVVFYEEGLVIVLHLLLQRLYPISYQC